MHRQGQNHRLPHTGQETKQSKRLSVKTGNSPFRFIHFFHPTDGFCVYFGASGDFGFNLRVCSDSGAQMGEVMSHRRKAMDLLKKYLEQSVLRCLSQTGILI